MNKALLPLALLLLAGCASAPGGKEKGAKNYPPGFPEALKNDAFDYYGLGNDDPLRMEVLSGAGGVPTYGTRQVRLDKVEGGKAVYVLKQEGALESQGTITLSLEADGLYTMASTASKLKPHTLEVPAKMDVGTAWKDHTDMSDRGILLDSDLKVEGRERVATPGGTFDDALRVTSVGGGKWSGKDVVLKTQSWYVSGMGQVKTILEIIPKAKGDPAQKVTVQLAAPEKAAPPVESSSLPAPSPPPATKDKK